jgi:two-component system chemotaxis response regulator CheY
MRVLIVDDDVVSRMMLMHMIDGAGHGADVVEAEDGEDAWRQLLDGVAPAILFCDLRMPHLSGMELLARVKADARFMALPFVLVSAASDAATMEQALGLGADGYIVKPFDAPKIASYLARLAPPEAGEDPEAVVRRLGIDAARLRLYLAGLQSQLAGAAPELGTLLADGRPQAARDLLARLAKGCHTLGLHEAAGALDALATGVLLDAETAVRLLDQAGSAAARQAEVAQHLPC